jgi:hypothetical protein
VAIAPPDAIPISVGKISGKTLLGSASMDVLLTLGIYLAPFLIIGIVVTRWMTRRGVGLADVRAEGSPHRRRSRFLLGIWRHDEPE